MELQTRSINNGENQNPRPDNTTTPQNDDFDSACSTPFVSAPSSPGRNGPVSGFYYSAPASPMHFAFVSSSSAHCSSLEKANSSAAFEFEFSARFGGNGSASGGSMSSADELFLNGQIRPMTLSTHLETPQVLAPLLDVEDEEEDNDVVEAARGRDLRPRDKSLRRRTRSMSPLRNTPSDWNEDECKEDEKRSFSASKEEKESVPTEKLSSSDATPSMSASSSRSSSAGRSSKRWVFLNNFLRSKSEGRSTNKFWSTITFSPAKEKKPQHEAKNSSNKKHEAKDGSNQTSKAENKGRKPAGKRPSAHELHYTANRAQAEEMRKKTYLPYRQGLIGCLGFSSKGYGAVNGFAKVLNPVSSG